MSDLFNNKFDPFDALIELNERLSRLERTHNKLARAYEESEKAFDVLLHSHQALQRAHLSVMELIGELTKVSLDSTKK